MATNVELAMTSFKPVSAPVYAQSFAKVLEDAGSPFLPERIEDSQNRPFVDLSQLPHAWHEGAAIVFRRTNPYEAITAMGVGSNGTVPSFLSSFIGIKYFDSPERLRTTVQFMQDLYELLSPCYGFICLPWMPKLQAAALPNRGLPGWAWGTFLGPEYDALVQFPARGDIEVRTMKDGGRRILLPPPADPSSPDGSTLTAYEHIRRHVDLRVFQPHRQSLYVLSEDPEHQVRQLDSILTKIIQESLDPTPVRLPQFRFLPI